MGELTSRGPPPECSKTLPEDTTPTAPFNCVEELEEFLDFTTQFAIHGTRATPRRAVTARHRDVH
jgi:hypothetical protein